MIYPEIRRALYEYTSTENHTVPMAYGGSSTELALSAKSRMPFVLRSYWSCGTP